MKLKTNTLNIPSGFGSASGTIFHKQIFFIDFDDKLPYSFWEITYILTKIQCQMLSCRK